MEALGTLAGSKMFVWKDGVKDALLEKRKNLAVEGDTAHRGLQSVELVKPEPVGAKRGV